MTERETEYLQRMATIAQARDRAVAALKDLTEQVDRSDAVDAVGHPLKNLKALADAKKVLREYWPWGFV